MAETIPGGRTIPDHGTATFYDAARRLDIDVGLRGVRPMTRGRRVIAPAYTLKFEPAGQPPASVVNFYDVIASAPPGHVLVIQVGADRWVLGANVSRFAELSGMAGVVLDGCVRDFGQIGERGYPIFAHGTSVTGYAPDLIFRSAGEDIVCGGVPVATGDVVVGDGDGVVCLPRPRLEEVLHEAEEIAQLDRQLGSDIEARRPLAELHQTRLRWAVRRTALRPGAECQTAESSRDNA